MKKKIYSIACISVIAFLVGSCAKEKNKYDKILISRNWQVLSDVTLTSSVQKTVTATSSQTISDKTGIIFGISTYRDYAYHEVVASPGSTTFDRTDNFADVSSYWTFNLDGTYSKTLTKNFTLTEHSTESTFDPRIYYPDNTTTSVDVGY